MYHQRLKSESQRFEEKYEVTAGGCWQWKTGNDDEYPKFWIGSGYIRASRYAWQKANGRTLLGGELVCHECDSPRCVNPDHLFIGTQTDNMRDRSRKGRYRGLFGTKNGRAKLTQKLAEEIRKAYAAGMSQDRLAKAYGVSQTVISTVVRNITWKKE